MGQTGILSILTMQIRSYIQVCFLVTGKADVCGTELPWYVIYPLLFSTFPHKPTESVLSPSGLRGLRKPSRGSQLRENKYRVPIRLLHPTPPGNDLWDSWPWSPQLHMLLED